MAFIHFSMSCTVTCPVPRVRGYLWSSNGRTMSAGAGLLKHRSIHDPYLIHTCGSPLQDEDELSEGSDDSAPEEATINPIAKLKRTYEQAIRIALLAQNLLDDVAGEQAV